MASDNELYTMYLRASPSTRTYSRISYTMLNYLGDLGGLIDIVWILGGVITAILIRNKFEAAVISDSYQIQKYNRDYSEYYSSSNSVKEKVLTSSSES